MVSPLCFLLNHFFYCVQREESLRAQFKNLSEELESQRNLHRTTLKRANEAETQLKENQERVTGLEGELLTSDVERDQLKDDKRKVTLWKILIISGRIDWLSPRFISFPFGLTG